MIQIECYYCKNETIHVSGRPNIRICDNCDVSINYIRNKINSIRFCRPISEKWCVLHILPLINQMDLFIGGTHILSIDHLEEITPDTVKEWMDRRLKLKAFI